VLHCGRASASSLPGRWLTSPTPKLAPFGQSLLQGCGILWDLATGQLKWTLEGHTSGMNGYGVSPDGRRIVSASADQTVKGWDLAIGHCLVR
jgi:WD40 repeat protein